MRRRCKPRTIPRSVPRRVMESAMRPLAPPPYKKKRDFSFPATRGWKPRRAKFVSGAEKS